MDRPSAPLAAPLALLVLLVTAAATAEEPDYGRTGPYVGLNGALVHLPDVGPALEDELEDEGFTVSRVELDELVSVTGRLGYRFHPNLAGEVAFEWLPSEEFEINGIGSGWEIESYVATGNLRGYLLSGRYQPYVLVGAGVMSSEIDFESKPDFAALVGPDYDFDESEISFAARFGAGVEVYVTPSLLVDLGVGYVLPTGELDELDLLSFVWGVGIRF